MSYDHVYLSPHFDDAALSCGGVIHQQTQRGEAVLVVTICAAPPGKALSAFAQQFHEAMGGPDDVVALRRQEDQAAIDRLGADVVWLDFRDGVYRGNDVGGWNYTDIDAIFGAVHPDDEALSEAIVAAVAEHAPPGPHTTLYAPLTVGRHVDHQLAHRAAWRLRERGCRIIFYEDFPYADPNYRLPFDQENTATLDATLASLEAARLTPHLVLLSDDNLQARIDSVRAYRSQVPMLFGDEAAMAATIRAFSMRFDHSGPAERLWVPE